MSGYARSEEKHNRKVNPPGPAQEMVIFLGVCSGAARGYVTVRTPFSIDALISSD